MCDVCVPLCMLPGEYKLILIVKISKSTSITAVVLGLGLGKFHGIMVIIRGEITQLG